MEDSPHYSLIVNRPSPEARRTARLTAALDAIREVARLDPDRARLANGAGFSMSDVVLGHRLAMLSPEQLQRDPVLASQALALAARYRRQLSPRVRYNLGVTDQRDLFD